MDTFSQTREAVDLFSEDFELQPDLELLSLLSISPKKEVTCHEKINTDVDDDGTVVVVDKKKVHSSSKAPTPTTRSAPPRTVTSPKRISAVRGDRSHTGGFSKKTLTENELGSIFEKMTSINARKLEVHRRQEADLAIFKARVEEEARDNQIKAKKEREQQLKMEEERLKNREHKIKLSSRREWDVRKVTGEQAQKRNVRERGRSDNKPNFALGQPVQTPGRGGRRVNHRTKRVISPAPNFDTQKGCQDWAEEMFVSVEENKKGPTE